MRTATDRIQKSFFISHEKLTDRDWMVLTPVELYKKYGIIPLEFVAEVANLILLIILVISVTGAITSFYRFNYQTFNHVLLHTDDLLDERLIVETDVLKDHIKQSVHNYYHIQEIAIQKFTYPSPDTHDPIYMTLLFKNGSHYWINVTLANPLGPLADMTNLQIATYIDEVDEISMEFFFVSIELEDYEDPDKDWEVKITYDNNDGYLTAELMVRQLDYKSPFWAFLISVFVVVCSLITILFESLELIKTLFVGSRTRKAWSEISPRVIEKHFLDMGIVPAPSKWHHLPVSVRLEFYSLWSIYSIIGALFVVVANIMAFVPNKRVPSSDLERLLFGIGILMSVSNMTKYLDFLPNFYTLIITLKYSMGKMARYLISVIPIFMAFTLAGTIMFSPHSANFKNYLDTIITLYALLNGDDMHGIFLDLKMAYPLGSFVPNVFLLIFSSLFTFAILNVFIFIIEDSFHLAKIVSARYGRDADVVPTAILEMYKSEYKAMMKKVDVEKVFLIIEREQARSTEDAMLLDGGSSTNNTGSSSDSDSDSDPNPLYQSKPSIPQPITPKVNPLLPNAIQPIKRVDSYTASYQRTLQVLKGSKTELKKPGLVNITDADPKRDSPQGGGSTPRLVSAPPAQSSDIEESPEFKALKEKLLMQMNALASNMLQELKEITEKKEKEKRPVSITTQQVSRSLDSDEPESPVFNTTIN